MCITAGIDAGNKTSTLILPPIIFYHQSYTVVFWFFNAIEIWYFTLNKVLQLYLLCSKCSEECSSELVVHNILYTMLFTVNTVNL